MRVEIIIRNAMRRARFMIKTTLECGGMTIAICIEAPGDIIHSLALLAGK